jgi:ubiquinone/menaquinone biosynthesis C-methylase UbiE
MAYSDIQIAGGDTATSRSLSKRLAIIQGALAVRGAKIMDCGCGAGEYVAALLEMGADAHGVEYNQDKVAQFRRAHPAFAARVAQGNIEQLDAPSEAFDAVLLNEVLEHVPDEKAALREIRRILKPTGVLILFSPNRLYPFETHSVIWKKGARRLPVYTPLIPYIPLALGDRWFTYLARNYWPTQLRAEVQACGYEMLSTGYLWQTFENISGQQPKILARVVPLLRVVFNGLEHIPGIRALGVSQYLIARKQA